MCVHLKFVLNRGDDNISDIMFVLSHKPVYTTIAVFNPLSPHSASKHLFATQKNELISYN